MSLFRDILDNLQGFTKAMYSTWFYYTPGGVLFDAGEGVATSLANTVFGVRKVFLSHGHYDHIGGLPGLVLARNSAMGEKTLPIQIFHPAGDPFIQLQREYVRHLARGLQFEVTWTSLAPGETVPLEAASGKWSVRTFPTRHVRSQTTLGYVLEETRTRLKPELKGTAENEIKKLVREQGREAVTEVYQHPLVAYTGDSMDVDPGAVRNAELLLHDTTFITEEEREAKIHATLEETLDAAEKAEVRALGLVHISTRYRMKEIEKMVRKELTTRATAIPVVIFHHARRVEIGP